MYNFVIPHLMRNPETLDVPIESEHDTKEEVKRNGTD
jgi:hypothetical protein